MNIRVTDTVDSVISKNLKAAKVLSRHGIDYSADGRKSIKEACADANVSFRSLMRTIRRAELYHGKSDQEINTLGVDALTRHIEQYYHAYACENIPFVRASLARLVRRYGKAHPELKEASALFDEMTAHITIQMQHEEMIVFPYIREMAKKGARGRSPVFHTAGSPIKEMMVAHQRGDLYLRRLGELTHHYVPPSGCDYAFTIAYEALSDFEKNLQQHLTVEDDILFPKALELEERFNRKTWLVHH